MIYLWQTMLHATCPSLETITHPHVQSKEINEISGIALSTDHIWAHNDSGDKARIFKLSLEGELLDIHKLVHVKAIDWEDMAIDHQTEVLFIADTGDNKEKRKKISIHRYAIHSRTHTTFPIVLPNGSRDIESIAFDPHTKHLYLLSKGRGGIVYLYQYNPDTRSPPRIAHQYTISAEEGLNPERLTAMDIAPNGSWIATRNYINISLYKRLPNQSVSSAMKEPPCIYPSPPQKQGESLAFSRDGQTLYTISEGESPVIYELRIRLAQP